MEIENMMQRSSSSVQQSKTAATQKQPIEALELTQAFHYTTALQHVQSVLHIFFQAQVTLSHHGKPHFWKVT